MLGIQEFDAVGKSEFESRWSAAFSGSGKSRAKKSRLFCEGGGGGASDMRRVCSLDVGEIS